MKKLLGILVLGLLLISACSKKNELFLECAIGGSKDILVINVYSGFIHINDKADPATIWKVEVKHFSKDFVYSTWMGAEHPLGSQFDKPVYLAIERITAKAYFEIAVIENGEIVDAKKINKMAMNCTKRSKL